MIQSLVFAPALFCLSLALSAPPAAPDQKAAPPVVAARFAPKTSALPPLPPGVTALTFAEFFLTPVGPRGLTISDSLKRQDGKRVRISGYMVRQEEPGDGAFFLVASPGLQIEEHEAGFSDLPAATVRVRVPGPNPGAVPFTPRLLLLTGTLNIGSREEADGTVSLVRLALDAPAPAAIASPPPDRPQGQPSNQ
ncbi:MAG: hypothetical protein H7Z41_10590 [Cytophagales bacterium]|nr:hypothetical protein [Armatimonadota bacterium]